MNSQVTTATSANQPAAPQEALEPEDEKVVHQVPGVGQPSRPQSPEGNRDVEVLRRELGLSDRHKAAPA